MASAKVASRVNQMAIFYRGIPIGSHWHTNDPRHHGFVARDPARSASLDCLMLHIGGGNSASPYISMTRSYGVAEAYAQKALRTSSSGEKAYVFEIELIDPLPAGIRVIDPVIELAHALPRPTDGVPYQHNGSQKCLLGLIDMAQYDALTTPCPQPPGSNPPALAPSISQQLRSLVFAIRDAEVLAIGTIPAASIRNRFEL